MESSAVLIVSLVNIKTVVLDQIVNSINFVGLSCNVNSIMPVIVASMDIGSKVYQISNEFIVPSISSKVNRGETI